jgi:TldD protein
VPHVELAVGDLPGGRWSATLVAFHQEIWVASHDGPVKRDVRQGSRVALKVWIDRYPKTMVAADLVLRADSPTLPDGLMDRLLERVVEKRRSVEFQSGGTTSAVFAPGVAGVVIHELFGHALEGDVNLGRGSWLQGIRARPQRKLTVIDDPRRGRGAWRIDDEGVPSRATVLIADGYAAGMLLDLTTARALGRSSTGHGRRSSYLTPPRPRMGCTWLGPGPDEPSDVLLDTNAGVFIRRMTSGHTDPLSGRASFLVTEADQIVAGRLERPLEPFVMALDGIDAWSSIDRVCSDLEFDTCIGSCVRDGQPLAVSVGAPTIRIGVIRVVA